MFVTKPQMDISSLPITSANEPRHSLLRTNVQIQWRMYWWIRSSYASGCLSLFTAIRDGSLKTDFTVLITGMRFNRTCLMMLSMFVNDRRDNWHELLPFVMHTYRTSVHESTGYSLFRLMMGEECSLPQDVNQRNYAQIGNMTTPVRDMGEGRFGSCL